MKKILIILLLLVSFNVEAATYYIDFNAANDSANGTSTATPWKRCPGMVGFAGTYSHNAGDIFVFKGGVTWPKDVFGMVIGYSGTAGNIDTYMGGQRCGMAGSASCNGGVAWGSGYPVFDGQQGLGAYASLVHNASPRSYLLIDGLKLQNVGDPTTATGTAISFTGGTHIEIKNCWLQPEGIQAFGYDTGSNNASAIYIHDNHISRAGRAVIYGRTGYVLDDVRVYNNVWEGPGNLYTAAYHLDGLMFGNPFASECTTSGGVPTVTNLLFYNNYFYGDWTAGSTAQLYSNSCTDYTYVYNNVFSFENTSPTKYTKDPIFSPGFVSFPRYDNHLYIYNNTFSNDAHHGYSDGKAWGAKAGIQIGGSTNYVAEMKGNIFSNLMYDIIAATSINLVIDYNLHNPNTMSATGRYAYIGTKQYCSSGCDGTWVQYQAAGYDAHSPTPADPKFIAIPNGVRGSGDWHLQASSPARNALPITQAPTNIFTTDYSGNPRPQGSAWDIGAYEYPEGNPIEPPPPQPAAPGNLSATASSPSQINLSWTDNSNNENGFKIERCMDAGCANSSLIATLAANVRTYSDTGLTANTTYYYRVRAYNSAGNSGYSNIASARTISASLPAAPSNLNVTVSASIQLRLSWTDNSNNETGFKIERCTGSSCNSFTQIASVAAGIRTYTNTGLSRNTTYTYRVRSYNSAGSSGYSNTASARTFPY